MCQMFVECCLGCVFVLCVVRFLVCDVRCVVSVVVLFCVCCLWCIVCAWLFLVFFVLYVSVFVVGLGVPCWVSVVCSLFEHCLFCVCLCVVGHVGCVCCSVCVVCPLVCVPFFVYWVFCVLCFVLCVVCD